MLDIMPPLMKGPIRRSDPSQILPLGPGNLP
jgi:hypothetical protein